MRNAIKTVALAATVLSCSLALSASPAVESKSGGHVAARPAAGVEQAPLALRVARGPMGLALRLAQALGLWSAPAAGESYGTQTIIDEPDPAGLSKNPKKQPPTEDEAGQHKSDDYTDDANIGSTPQKAMSAGG